MNVPDNISNADVIINKVKIHRYKLLGNINKKPLRFT